MKNYIKCLLLFLLISCSQEGEKYKISIDLTGFENEVTLVLNKADTIKMTNELVHFSVSKIKEPKKYSIQIFKDSIKKPLTVISFWYENVDVLIKGIWSPQKKHLIENVFVGGKLQSVENSFTAIFEKYGKITDQLFASKRPRKEIGKVFEGIKKSIKKDFVNLSFKKPNNIISLSKIVTYSSEISKDSILLYYNSLSNELKKNKKGVLLKKLSSTKKLQIGGTIENFTAFDTKGNKMSLFDYKGKIILLDFWASWCKPCHQQNKDEFVGLYKKYKEKGLVIISYSLDKENKEKAWKLATKKDSITWVSISNLRGWENDPLAFQYSVKAVPNSFLINREGVIVNSFLDYKKGQHHIEDAIIKLLKE